ncbi:MAG: flavin-containing monooxygenase [Hyphomonadaceae bacterium]
MSALASAPTIEDLVGPLDFDLEALRKKYAHERDTRLTEATSEFTSAVDGKFANFSKDPWVDPNYTRAPIEDHTEVVIAGGGFGGLLMAGRLYERGFRDIRIIEIGGDFGGTWYWNRYPGAMCDVEAHMYLPLLEELNYTPKHRYAYAGEILELCNLIGRTYDLYRRSIFQTTITSVRWQEDEKKWLIETDRGDRLTTNYFIPACGRQSLPKLPGIPGIDRYKGHAFHTSRWDYKYTGGSEHDFDLVNLRDKRVAVIGTGATAIQVVPEVAKWAKELLVFQRTPSTVGERLQCETGADWVNSTPGWQRRRRDNFAKIALGMPQDHDEVNDGWTRMQSTFRPYTPAELAEKLGRPATPEELAYMLEIGDHRVMNQIRARIESVVKDPKTAEGLKPWYRYMCKRPGFHDDYLEAFNRPNVRLVDTKGRGVEQLSEHGIIVDGEEYEVDCLIFATGFESVAAFTRLTGFEPEGRGGVPLNEHWKDGVRTLHGAMTDKFPNMFIIGATQQAANPVNVVELLDEQAHHVADIMAEMKRRNAPAFEASKEAVDDYVQAIRNSPQNKQLFEFYGTCTPGYYNAQGKAKKGADLFFGDRYGEGPIAFYDMLRNWRADGTLPGIVASP